MSGSSFHSAFRIPNSSFLRMTLNPYGKKERAFCYYLSEAPPVLLKSKLDSQIN
jgi:hypothetical protein